MRGKEAKAGVREAVAECEACARPARTNAGLYRAGGEKDYEEAHY